MHRHQLKFYGIIFFSCGYKYISKQLPRQAITDEQTEEKNINTQKLT